MGRPSLAGRFSRRDDARRISGVAPRGADLGAWPSPTTARAPHTPFAAPGTDRRSSSPLCAGRRTTARGSGRSTRYARDDVSRKELVSQQLGSNCQMAARSTRSQPVVSSRRRAAEGGLAVFTTQRSDGAPRAARSTWRLTSPGRDGVRRTVVRRPGRLHQSPCSICALLPCP